MGDVAPWLVFALVLSAILGGLARLAARVRRRGVGHQFSGPMDMIFRPHTYDLGVEIQIQQERMTPRPSVDDKAKPDTADRLATKRHTRQDPRSG